MRDSKGDDVWYVRFASSDVRTFTLEQLDTAYQTGEIDDDTLVRQDGSLQWEKLAAVAGIEKTHIGMDPKIEIPVTQRPLPNTAVAKPSKPPPPLPVKRAAQPSVAPDFSAFAPLRATFQKRKKVIFAALAGVLVLIVGGVAVAKLARKNPMASAAKTALVAKPSPAPAPPHVAHAAVHHPPAIAKGRAIVPAKLAAPKPAAVAAKKPALDGAKAPAAKGKAKPAPAKKPAAKPHAAAKHRGNTGA